MKIGVVGSEPDFQERLERMVDSGTVLVPCSVDDLTHGSPEALQAIVLGPQVPIRDALHTAQTLDSTRPEIGVVLVADPHPKMLRAALLAGARDVWSPDIEDDDLQARLEPVLSVAARRSDVLHPVAAVTAGEPHQVIVVVSPKGGTGKTTLATNLAFGMAMASDDPIVLVDLDLQFGDVATALSLMPERTVADAARLVGNTTAVKTSLAPHPTGVHALCAPIDPAEADLITPEATGQILDTLAAEFGTTIIDTSAGLDEHTLAALDRATDLVVVSTTDIFAVTGTRRLLDVLEEIDIGEPDRHLVLNRANARVDIDRAQIENTLNWAVDVEIPSTRAVPLAMNRGESLLDGGRIARKPMLELLARFVDEPARSLKRVGR